MNTDRTVFISRLNLDFNERKKILCFPRQRLFRQDETFVVPSDAPSYGLRQDTHSHEWYKYETDMKRHGKYCGPPRQESQQEDTYVAVMVYVYVCNVQRICGCIYVVRQSARCFRQFMTPVCIYQPDCLITLDVHMHIHAYIRLG